MLTIQVGDNESSKYCLSVLTELKNRGIKDILVRPFTRLIYTTNAIESLNSTYCYKRLSFEKYSKVLRNSHVIWLLFLSHFILQLGKNDVKLCLDSLNTAETVAVLERMN